MSQKSYEKQINQFTINVSATLQIKNIDKQTFYNDINDLKNKTLNQKDFKQKYNSLFDGTVSKFKNTESFLGSYRRNINLKYFNQSKSKDIIKWNKELREQTIKEISKKEGKQIITKEQIAIINYPTKEGQYGVAELIDSKEPSKWIKFKSKKDFLRQLGILLDSDSLESKYDVIFHGFGTYTEYTETEYQNLLEYV